ncbi:hypothetical protein CW749_05510 [Vibrio sp. vnigr-6D03]|uniref:hypothetical protein n=1 Tax=Vibrio sp. vnigr-6D03 TaxID=2058088 RepID=UPI000C34FE37|nr:hypothetical protein [Vibrio sp. vnigr-6D03]PKF80633.1 hypothetical protein CW749_05510 [Vibrio sp. vnigr-6D03]
MKSDFCSIDGYRPSKRTLTAIDEMNNVIKMSNYLDKIVALLPFYQIFAGRSSYRGVALTSAGWNASTYDWKLFNEAMMAIPEIKRVRLENIAEREMMFGMGKDYDFWKCVFNSL